MKIVIQRVLEAGVKVNGEWVSQIGPGLLLLVGIEKEDQQEKLNDWALKIIQKRIFEDQDGKMNLSLLETSGEVLVVSQFTLAADFKKGRRPGFSKAEKPELAEPMIEKFINKLVDHGAKVKKGIFGAGMNVHLINDGPVTFVIDE